MKRIHDENDATYDSIILYSVSVSYHELTPQNERTQVPTHVV